MKKNLIVALLLMAAAVQVNGQAKPQATEKRAGYAFLWGLFKSKDYGKGTSSAVHAEVVTSKSFSKTKIDTTHYEEKQFLWGAVQWTEKRKSTTEKPLTNKP